MLDRLFGIGERGSSVRTECVAGTTTFLTLSYIVFVNPQILSAAGIDFGAALVATCVAGAVGTGLMGLYANYPIAVAPGMGINAYFAFTVVGGMGYSWEVALGAVFVSGVAMVIISLLPIRKAIIHTIPHSQKMAMAAGIGAFLALIAMQSAGITIGDPNTLLAVGDLAVWPVVMAAVGVVAITALDHLKVPGSILIGILTITVIAWLTGLYEAPSGSLVSAPPSVETFLKLDIAGALGLGLVVIVGTFFMIDLFDTTPTLVAVMSEAGLTDEDGRLPGVGRALVADGTATVVGSVMGTSTTTSYVESAAGVRAGGRTGLAAVVVAALFLLALVIAPVAEAIPGFATAPAIFFVACVMMRMIAKIDWGDLTESVPAMVTVFAMPFTFSVSTGLGLGFLSYTTIKLFTGRAGEVGVGMWVVSALFALKFAFA